MGAYPDPSPPHLACAHTVGLGHLFHQGAHAVLHPERLRVAAGRAGVKMRQLLPTTVAPPFPKVLNPLQF